MSEHPREIIPEKVIAALRRHAETVFGGRGVDVVYLYGSVATGLAHPFSDVDIALLVSEEKAAMTPYDRLQFEIDIELAIEQVCGIDYAEVRVINDAPLIFRGQIATKGISLYTASEERRIAFETQTWKEYFDYQPWERLMSQAFWARLRKEGLGDRTRQNRETVRQSGWSHR